jgi:hypothetical protein
MSSHAEEVRHIAELVDSAEYWESPSSKVGQLIGAVQAAATGEPDKFPATNRSVDL